MAGRPTINTVAAAAGVSRQTVSNTINSPQIVDPRTRQRVLAAIEQLNYTPSAAAAQLRTRRSRVIGLRLQPETDGINGAVLDRFLHAFTVAAQRESYRVMLFTAPDDAAEIAQYSQLVAASNVDAFLLTSTHAGDPRTAWLASQGLPFVTFGRPWTQLSEADRHAWVDVDGAAGTRLATEHLLQLGHRRIAYVGFPRSADLADERLSGWATAMADVVSAESRERLARHVCDGVDAGSRAAESLLAESEPTAFVCASDSLALGALSHVRRIGQRCAVIGFDDTPVAAAVDLASVAQPLTQAAEAAFDLVLAQLNGESPSPRQYLLTPHLALRGSGSVTPDPSTSRTESE